MKKYTEKRPWGKFERFCLNERCSVKIVTVKAGEELSLQKHKQRDEFWRVLSGRPEVTVGKKTTRAKEGDEFFIPRETRHQIKAGKKKAEMLEVSFGKFKEEDIIRIKDKYGR